MTARDDGSTLGAATVAALSEQLRRLLAEIEAGRRMVLGRCGWTAVLRAANRTADTMKQLLAALRLPDLVTGRRPRRRPPRGVYRPRRL